MSFLRRLLGGRDQAREREHAEPADAALDPAADEEAEQRANLALLRAEQERLDELRQRQLRYAKWAWRPPAQGGPRRADDEDRGAGGDEPGSSR